MKSHQTGFTLIEIIIVVVIISILAVFGVQMISSGSVERNLQQHGRILQSSIQYSCDQATLQNIPYGVKFFQSGYAFSQFINQQWIDLIAQETLISRELTDGSQLTLEIEGKVVVLQDDVGEVPHIICDNNGQITSFVLLFSDATETHHYQLKTINFWQLEGQWLDDEKIN
jgi:prepilin-type N-terminal cleavage/methylation domain-containing protein